MGFKLSAPEPKPKLTGKDIAETAGRSVLTGAVGGLSALPGFAGNIAEVGHELVARPIAKHVFGEDVSYEQTPLGKLLKPTRGHIQAIEEAVPFLKPRNKVEKFSQDVVKDAVELFAPGRAFQMGRYAQGPMRSSAISLAANTAGEGVTAFTGDESKGDLVKRGTMLGLSLFNPTGAREIPRQLYQRADALLHANEATSAAPWVTRINNLEQRITQGRPLQNLAPSERFVVDQIQRFRDLIQNGQFNMRQLVSQRRSFNEELNNHLFNLPNRAERARARELAQEIGHATRETMAQYGTRNPQWWRLQSSGDQAFGAIAQSNYISRVLENFMRGRPEALAHVFGVGLPGAIGGLMSAPAGLASSAVYLGAKLAHRIWNSPALLNHYAKVAGAAAAENTKVLDKELDSFQKKVEKEEKKGKKKYRLSPK